MKIKAEFTASDITNNSYLFSFSWIIGIRNKNWELMEYCEINCINQNNVLLVFMHFLFFPFELLVVLCCRRSGLFPAFYAPNVCSVSISNARWFLWRGTRGKFLRWSEIRRYFTPNYHFLRWSGISLMKNEWINIGNMIE